MKIGFVSLGCPKNQLDTEVMLHEVMEAGYEITPEDIDADVIIVNTCAFIESAKKEAIDNILDVAWLKKNRHLKAIIVTGCLAERYGEEIFKELPEVDAVLGVGSIHRIVDAVRAVTEKVKKGEARKKFYAHDDRDSVALGGDRVLTTPDYTAYLKIAEGCDNRCSYCAIPSIRGKFRSRPMEELVAEANGKVMAFVSNKLDPLFESNDLKANGTGVYQEVFDTVDYDNKSGADVVDILLDGMEAVGYTVE